MKRRQLAGGGLSGGWEKVGQAVGAHPSLVRAGVCALRFLAGFLLSRAVIFEECAPFGVGFVAASGSGAGGLFSLLGAVCGYMSLWGDLESLKYVAVLVLVFCAAFVFRGTAAARRVFFVPVVTLITGALIGLVFVLGQGFSAVELLLFVTELTLMAAGSYFYKVALDGAQEEGDLRRSIGQLVLMATLLLSLSGWVMFGVVHPARVFACVFVLQSAHQGGVGVGSATGLAVGLAIDMGMGRPFFSMAYGVSGLLAGMFQRRNKLVTAILFVITCGVAALWAGDAALRNATLFETFIASVLFMLIPEKGGARSIRSLESDVRTREHDGKRMQNYVRRRLENSSSAFREVYESLQGVFDGLGRQRNDNDIATVFDRTAEKVCRRCAVRATCWNRDAQATAAALSDATVKLNKKGTVDAEDFPAHFAARCVQLGKFTQTANDEMSVMLIRRQYKSRLAESRAQVCRQYSEMSRILTHVAAEVGQGVSFDEEAERRLGRYLRGNKLALTAQVYRDAAGRRWVEMEGDRAGELLRGGGETLIKQIGMCVGFPVSLPEQVVNPKGERLIFSEVECFAATLGVASHRKKGEEVSGDSGTYFKTAEGKLFVLLSDGMGSGREAAVGSSQAIRLLERFLRAGIQPEIALETLNSSLVLKGEGGLVTVDLLICDLLTGEARFFKNGASTTYAKKARKVHRINGKTLPVGVGLQTAGAPDMTSMMLQSGELVTMVSDGVIGAEGDGWLVQTLQAYEDSSPKALASEILRQAALRQDGTDDMTVIVLELDRRKETELE